MAEKLTPESHTKSGQSSSSPPKAKTPKKSHGGAGWLLSLLLLLALGGAGFWGWQQLQQLQTLVQQLQQQLQQQSSTQQSQATDWEQKLQNSEQNLTASIARLRQQTQAKPRDWILLEVESLLRLANQYLWLTGDVPVVLALLNDADELLQALEDPSLLPVREAIAVDKLELESLPEMNAEDTLLVLAAMIEQVPNLPWQRLVQQPQEEIATEEVELSPWQKRLQTGWEQLKEIIVVRRREPELDQLLSEQYQTYVRQQIILMLEQVQWAVLQQNATLYQQKLAQVQQQVTKHMATDNTKTEVFLTAVTELQQEEIAGEVPDISTALKLLQQVQAS